MLHRIAYTALPLLLNALDVKLSASKSQSATRQRRFRYYAEVMQLYRDRYDGTDGVAVFIQQALRFADTLNIAITFPDKHGGELQHIQFEPFDCNANKFCSKGKNNLNRMVGLRFSLGLHGCTSDFH